MRKKQKNLAKFFLKNFASEINAMLFELPLAKDEWSSLLMAAALAEIRFLIFPLGFSPTEAKAKRMIDFFSEVWLKPVFDV